MKVKKVTAEDIRRKSYKRDKETLSDKIEKLKRFAAYDTSKEFKDIVDNIEKHVRGFIQKRLDDLFNLENYINISIYKRFVSEETNVFVNSFRHEVKKIRDNLMVEAGEELTK